MEVAHVEHLGGSQIVTLRAGPVRLQMIAPPSAHFASRESAHVSVDPRNLYLFDAATGDTLAAPGLSL
jgi:ABC-type sugar transport system ATPase subunit